MLHSTKVESSIRDTILITPRQQDGVSVKSEQSYYFLGFCQCKNLSFHHTSSSINSRPKRKRSDDSPRAIILFTAATCCQWCQWCSECSISDSYNVKSVATLSAVCLYVCTHLRILRILCVSLQWNRKAIPRVTERIYDKATTRLRSKVQRLRVTSLNLSSMYQTVASVHGSFYWVYVLSSPIHMKMTHGFLGFFPLDGDIRLFCVMGCRSILDL